MIAVRVADDVAVLCIINPAVSVHFPIGCKRQRLKADVALNGEKRSRRENSSNTKNTQRRLRPIKAVG